MISNIVVFFEFPALGFSYEYCCMAGNRSAGILLYRTGSGTGIEVLLVHPGGPYHRHKDLSNWSIPKGMFEEGEDSLAAAKREFEEELGSPPPEVKYRLLPPVKQKSGKLVYAWTGEGDFDLSGFRSNIFRMEYPHKSGRWIEVPEIDRAGWFDLSAARKKMLPAQILLLDELEALIGSRDPDDGG